MMSDDEGILLAQELFGHIEIRTRKPEERLYRLVEDVLDNQECGWVDRITWDSYDSSVEIYLDQSDVPGVLDLTRLFAAGFHRVWVHPFSCTKNGTRDHETCRCPCRRSTAR